MSIMLTKFDVCIKEKRVNHPIGTLSQVWCLIVSIPDLCTLTYFYGSLCFELLPQQMSQSKKKYIDLCQHANKYKQVVLKTLS